MGLVAYASSDEESDNETPHPQAEKAVTEALPGPAPVDASQNDPTKAPPLGPSPSEDPHPTTTSLPNKPQLGPELGPQLGPQPDSQPLPEPDQFESQSRSRSQPQDQRSLIHSLTLPSIPNLSIPPSPPGSPPPLLTSKLQTFLALKRNGTHFNNKLLASTSLRNPSLMDKLLAYADITDADQYTTTLPPDLWDPNAFPEWAYRDRLRRTREKVVKRREAERAAGNRTAVDFVPAVGAAGTDGAVSGGGVGGLSRGEDRAGNWR